LFLTAAGRALIGDLPDSAHSAWLLPVWLGGAAAGAWLFRRQCGAATSGLLAAGALLGCAAAWLLFRFWVGGDFLYRYFLTPAFFGAALVAALLAAIRLPAVRWGALALAALPGLIFYGHFVQIQTNEGPRADFQRWIAPRLVPGDRVIFDDLADLGYFWLAGPAGTEPLAYHTHGAAFLRDTAPDRVVGAADAGAATGGTIWRVRQAGADPARTLDLDAALLRRWRPIGRWETAGRSFLSFRGPIDWRSSDGATFGERIRLSAVALPAQAAPGTSVPVSLHWRALAPIEADFTVFVHLTDGAGQRAAQDDAPPARGARPTSTWPVDGSRVIDLHWLDLPPDLTPGVYEVSVGLYRGETRLALADGTNAYPAGRVEVRP
ncbi:MAG TPA: hypothetical protein VHL09_10085, partial [Dehalococcoidia bacterium]|nr:hypothetical protein [Dehalococcoidia bacterium]